MPGAGRNGITRHGPVRLAGLVLILHALMWPHPGTASESFLGRPVQEALESLRKAGAPLVYSTNLVTPDLVVETEPRKRQPLAIAGEILAPHGLALKYRDGFYVVVRASAAATGGPRSNDDQARMRSPDSDSGPAELEKINVTASRYVLQSASQFFVDQRAIQALPDLGEDPIRSAQRLPGTAASGLSSRSHFRGGTLEETAIYLNGLQLLDPFHIRDYHSIFSTIDARAISGIEAYTGGFPAQFGDRMSGVLTLESQSPAEPRHTEIGLSVYNTSVLHSGFSEGGDWDWLLSARESNLDIILNPDLGSPDYFDVFSQIGHRLSERHHLSANTLYAKDSVVVITESDPEELERSDSNTENLHFWLRLQSDWLPGLNSVTVLSVSSFENVRVAEMTDPDKMIARADDQREADVHGLKQDWLWSGLPGHEIGWGFEFRDQDARYRYLGIAAYQGLLADLPGLENPREYRVEAVPGGYALSLYLSDRWTLNEATWLQYGLRWDRQTWTQPKFDDQLSPRISLLHRIGERTDVRFSWGRYYQSQAIHRLQVEDGLDQFFAPQRAEHFIVGIRHRFSNGLRLRAEAFVKNYDHVKPRFENLFDPLALIPELAPDRVRLDPASADSRGVELSMEYRGNGHLDWWTSYVFSRATDRINARDEARSWDQRHALQAGVSWRRDPWEVGVAVSAHTGWPTTPLLVAEDPEDDEFMPIPGPRNSLNFRTFWTLDFRVSRQFDVRKGRLSAFLEVSNATNRDNPCCVDYDIDDEVEPGVVDRSVDYWVPIIPAIGILWEF